MPNRFTSLLIIAALCLNNPPLTSTAPTPTASPPQSNRQLSEQHAGSLSDSSSGAALDPTQSQAGQNPPTQDQPIRLKTELIDLRAVVTDKRGRPTWCEAVATQIH